jgi:hypothetical protein
MKKKLHYRVLFCTLMFFTFFNASSQTVVWNGSVNSSWFVAGNWTPDGIPDGTSEVSIAAAANQPVIAGDATAGTLTMETNTSLTIESGSNLTVAGTLTVDNSAILIVESSANLIQTNNVANLGKITVKRNSSALVRQDYTLWSAPVSGQNLLAFSPQTNTTRFYTYNSATNVYNSIAPSANIFTPTQGYLIRMPNNHPTAATVWNGQFTGVPNNGNYAVTMSNGGAGMAFNLIGNPYPSALDMTSFVADNQDAITGTLYFWRETNGNTSNNAYCTWAGGTFTGNGEAQVTDPDGIIQAGQGFFVEAKTGQTALAFNNSQRVSANTATFFRNGIMNERSTVWLNVTNTSGAFSQMAVGYISGATAGADIFDGKYLADGTIALNSILNNTDYVIQGRPTPFDPGDVVPLSFKTDTAGNYTIVIDHTLGLFAGQQDIFLKDNLMGIVHNLKTSPYAFTSGAGSFNDRFEVIYQAPLAVFQPSDAASSVTVYKQQQQIVINTGQMPMAAVRIFDVCGRLLAGKDNIDAGETRLGADFSNGVVVVRITLKNGVTVTKKIIN